MLIIPAIDLKDARCVRLTEGRADSERVYDREPIEVARGFETDGAQLIHLVDLDGAFLGRASENYGIISRIAREIRIPVEVGGGVRSIDDIRRLLEEVGARYVVIGTLAIEEPDTLEKALAEFGDSLVVGIDARAELVATRGWTETTRVRAVDLAQRVASLGVSRIIYTDITRDGKLEGPNVIMTKQIAEASGISVTASGGVSSLEDIDALCEIEAFGVDSVIVGKALYEGRFALAAAIDHSKLNSAANH
ncbi:MAG TPA: 1-(5-phosphoribosyl)-5-[(5-phosphoribosylamino)methylideneamino]imidazole-4-carboxamide isomerase [Blastocatellia bacterium]|nr:1-(5-phosphoribosyl)-5-[(5-phosphoribosylamino)methylideneamino]imidazole-4-carboxamide isomerase [Blastocatellia bacterium]